MVEFLVQLSKIFDSTCQVHKQIMELQRSSAMKRWFVSLVLMNLDYLKPPMYIYVNINCLVFLCVGGGSRCPNQGAHDLLDIAGEFVNEFAVFHACVGPESAQRRIL